MPRNKPDDPFTDDDWGPQEGSSQESSEVPEATVDPNRLPWLKPSHVLPSGRQGTLELVSYQGRSKYSDATLVVKVNGKSFHLGLQFFDPSFAALRRAFGPNKDDWHGTLQYKVMPHKGRADGFVAVRPSKR